MTKAEICSEVRPAVSILPLRVMFFNFGTTAGQHAKCKMQNAATEHGTPEHGKLISKYINN